MLENTYNDTVKLIYLNQPSKAERKRTQLIFLICYTGILPIFSFVTGN